jgi:hypothetical protein
MACTGVVLCSLIGPMFEVLLAMRGRRSSVRLGGVLGASGKNESSSSREYSVRIGSLAESFPSLISCAAPWFMRSCWPSCRHN